MRTSWTWIYCRPRMGGLRIGERNHANSPSRMDLPFSPDQLMISRSQICLTRWASRQLYRMQCSCHATFSRIKNLWYRLMAHQWVFHVMSRWIQHLHSFNKWQMSINWIFKSRDFLVSLKDFCYLAALAQTIRRDANAGEERSKTIISNVSAKVCAGEILAVVGPSGSGKSTLLDAVAGRIETSCLQGEIRVNGVPMRTGFKRISSYVMQVT